MYIRAQRELDIGNEEYQLLSFGTPAAQQNLQVISGQKYGEDFLGGDTRTHNSETDRKLGLFAEELRSRGVNVELRVEDETHPGMGGQQLSHTVLTINNLDFSNAARVCEAAAEAVSEKIELSKSIKPFAFQQQRSQVDERAAEIKSMLKQTLQDNPCPSGKDPVEHCLDIAAKTMAEQEQQNKGQQRPPQRWR